MGVEPDPTPQRSNAMTKPKPHDKQDKPAPKMRGALMGSAPTSTPPPAAWHPDPHRRFQLRYWDGSKWTDDVSDDGKQSKDPAGA
jgi:Protein of unknown function (DUF2510)